VYENTTERSKDKSNKMLIWVLNEWMFFDLRQLIIFSKII
jgi:hypothetical protein